MDQSRISQDVKDGIYILGGLAVATGLIATAVKFCGWFRRRWHERKERRNATKNALVAIEARLTKMDDERGAARKTDVDLHAAINEKLDGIIATQHDMQSDIRLILPACGAALDGLIQHDKTINGPVVRWRTRLENRIAEGVGAPKSPSKDGG